jgi:hypothetical protein
LKVSQNEYKTKLDEIKIFQQKLKDESTKNASFQKKIAKLKKENDEKSVLVDLYEGLNEKMMFEMNDLRKINEQETQRNFSQQNEIASNLNDENREIKRLRQELKNELTKNAALQKKITNLNRENDKKSELVNFEFVSSIDQLTVELNELRKINLAVTQRQSTFENEINLKSTEIERLHQKLKDELAKNDTFQKKITSLKKEYDEKSDFEKKQYVSRIDQLTVEINDLRKINQAETQRLSSLQNELNNKSREIKNLKDSGLSQEFIIKKLQEFIDSPDRKKDSLEKKKMASSCKLKDNKKINLMDDFEFCSDIENSHYDNFDSSDDDTNSNESIDDHFNSKYYLFDSKNGLFHHSKISNKINPRSNCGNYGCRGKGNINPLLNTHRSRESCNLIKFDKNYKEMVFKKFIFCYFNHKF